jgi:GGDEF domain-containing protein
MSESELKNNLASRLVEQAPDDDLHTVTIGDGHLATEIIFSHVEGDGFVSVQTAEHEDAWQGKAEAMADRFRAEVEGLITHSPKFRKATSVTYSPGDSQPVSFNVAHEIEVTDE